MSRPAVPSSSMRMAGRVPPSVPAILSLAILAGCSGGPEKFAPLCPQLKLLRDTADLTRVRGAGTDVTDLIVNARIDAMPASCSEGPKGAVKANMKVVMSATRGPSATSNKITLPYLVTVTMGETILEQQYFVASGEFPSNVDRMTVTGDEIDFLVPATPEKPASAYTIYVSFRLTDAELAYNRAHRK